jgi:hypothetical protein
VAVRIRLASPDDGEAVAAIYRPVVAETAISFETAVPSGDEMTCRIEETLRSYPWPGCDVDGCIDVGWWQLTLERHEASPSAPLDLDAVSSHSEWADLLRHGESVIRAEAA